MKKRSFLILFSILLGLLGCNTANNVQKEIKSLSSGFEVIASSRIPFDYLEYTEGLKALLVYHSDQAEDIKNFGIEYEILTGDKAPSFEGNMIIAKSGTKSTGGYDIYVESVKDIGRYTEVAISYKIPGEGCIVTMAVTNPYTIVLIPNDPKDVKFIENNVSTSCN